jgi:hypothetical protein
MQSPLTPSLSHITISCAVINVMFGECRKTIDAGKLFIVTYLGRIV